MRTREGFTVKVVERKQDEIHILFPAKPHETHELGDEEPENVGAAGMETAFRTPVNG